MALAQLALVVSNHPDLGPVVEASGIPFHHVPVTRATKAEAEARQLALCEAAGVELVVLARAVRWHLEDRVLVYGNKTVVFA